MSKVTLAILALIALLVIAVYVQAFTERSRLRRAALDRPAKFARSARERRARHALAQARYQRDMTLDNYHALRATEDALEHGSQELHRETA